LRNYDAPDAWVRRIAINVSRDRMRSDRRRRDREAAVVAPPTPDVTDSFDADEGASELLAGLAARQREVATLFYLEDCSVDDIADRLGVSAGTVKFHLARARDRLRDANPD
jgi:RNA polymerase sigma-70 factor (ECF subfamily)